jgi:hypothetical protein
MESGASVKVSVEPQSAATTECAAQSVESVSWILTNPTVASTKPQSAVEAWLTAVTQGETGLVARIRFKDGRSSEVRPRYYFTGSGYRDVDVLRVVSAGAPPAGSIRVLGGRVRLEPFSNAASSWRVTMPFTIDQQGLVRVRVDWVDPLSRIDFAALGPCPGACVVISPTVYGVKPIAAQQSRVAPGPFTLRLDNLGSLEETLSYEVWLVPGA